MAKRLTTEDFVVKAKKVHGDKYVYLKSVYTTAKDPIVITCPIHGDFKQTPNNHTNGGGCMSCGGRKRSTTCEFVQKAVELHGDTYDYSMSIYESAKKPITIGCRIHGDIKITPDSHLRGGTCLQCANEARKVPKITQKEFLDRSRILHANYYDYSKVVYTGIFNKVTIVCPYHGEFEQMAHSHLRGHGCVGCAESSVLYTNFPTITYYIKLEYNGVTKYKVGITSKGVQKRFEREVRLGYDIEVLSTVQHDTGRPAFMLEQLVLKTVRYKKHSGYAFLHNAIGDTELFDEPLTKEELSLLNKVKGI